MENKYEAVQGDIEKIIIAKKQPVSIGNDLETNFWQLVKERELDKGEN